MLILEGVAKEYNLKPILEDIHLSLEPGQVYALTAPNGSGKTTLLQMMAGLVRPTRGRVLWDGGPIRTTHRRHFGVLLQQPMLYGDLSASENLAFYARLYGLPQHRQLVQSWLEQVGLGDTAAQRVRSFSKGMKQRLALARCFIHKPDVLLLDEPFDGLDERGRAILTRLFEQRINDGASVFLVTHREDEVRIAARRYTLRFGRVTAC
ncbi:heme ABC exporter ATP-binding protein CcmA [Alicyclobacillus ferrooxydans]|uniref:ABC transporter domain-containing protein n=1 Tax=Alicyclobacillus ferrooxydans TaxID=471514 RepID=A0A0P9GNL0_9BACL|nr:heme ABC exporter ATP-binding protein CcmA [Alicyclobacillus ferrooxydans]KPV42042.1 hypothetical protein AN477_19945 [Alicyclobacillus ferrooxydans]